MILDSMLIGIDASRSILHSQKTGVEVVSDELIKALLMWPGQNSDGKKAEFLFYTPKPIDWLPRERQRILAWPFLFIWSQLRLAWELFIHPPDVFLTIAHYVPLFNLLFKRKTKFAAYIHDVAFRHRPQAYSLVSRLYLNLAYWYTARLAHYIFVPSHITKQEMVRFYPSAVPKLHVIPHGYNRKNKNDSSPKRKMQILYVGRVEEKKNIANLVKAFQIFREKHKDYKLILAGKPGHGYGKFRHLLTEPGVEELGYISNEQKQELLSESAVLALVSREEGFGIPLLEGFDFGLPVLAADLPVLREVGGEACVYVKPDDVSDIVQGLASITSDYDLRAVLVHKGKERLEAFSWSKAARHLMEAIS